MRVELHVRARVRTGVRASARIMHARPRARIYAHARYEDVDPPPGLITLSPRDGYSRDPSSEAPLWDLETTN